MGYAAYGQLLSVQISLPTFELFFNFYFIILSLRFAKCHLNLLRLSNTFIVTYYLSILIVSNFFSVTTEGYCFGMANLGEIF